MCSNELNVPIDYLIIYTHQRDDKELLANRKKSCHSTQLQAWKILKINLRTKTSNSDGKGIIWIPEVLLVNLLDWHHVDLQYSEARGLEDYIRTTFTCPKLSQMCKDIASK